MPAGRILITSGYPWAASPSWSRMDEVTNCRSPGFEVVSGRSNVFEFTDVGTATVHFADRARVLDTDALVGKGILLQVRNPVTGIWRPTFRGVIDEPTFDVYPLTSGLVSTVQLRCVDMFAYLGRVEMALGRFGHPPNHGFEGSITFGEQRVDDRLRTALFASYTDPTAGASLGGALIPPELTRLFSGNVRLWDVSYDVGESILVVCRDAADAEWPGIANIYCAGRDIEAPGAFTFHGRMARFDPDGTEYPGVAWDFTRWHAGDGAAVAASPTTTAQVRSLAYARPSDQIFNSAIAWPRYVETSRPNEKRTLRQEEKDALGFENSTSQGFYGYRSLPPMADLLVKEGYGEFNAGNDGLTECRTYAEYYVQNYASPMRVPVVTFKPVHPDDPRAAATWKLLTQMEISDALVLTIGAAGLSGAEYFVEGYRLTVQAMDPAFDYVELTPNLTPVERWAVYPT